MSARVWRSVVALSGGVGGARLVHGLSRALAPEALTTIVNTGDDFEHWGLAISPDLDTVMYTLADLADVERGWGLAVESFAALAMMKAYGEDAWFNLGDRDLATHLTRTRALRSGEPLSRVTARLCAAIGVRSRVLPMTDEARPTMIDTVAHGTLPFQQWFVKHRAAAVHAVRFESAPPPAPGVIDAIAAAELVVIGPSNPYVSIDPILTLPGVREAIAARPVVAVSPIIGGRAVKGPLAEMIEAIAHEPPSPAAIVRHYAGLVTGIVVEEGEAPPDAARTKRSQTIMRTREDSLRLARDVLAFAAEIA
jgi:LPPG:FO 2-phospho-L-lactate transferase